MSLNHFVEIKTISNWIEKSCISIDNYHFQGGLLGFQFGWLELPNFQKLATTFSKIVYYH